MNNNNVQNDWHQADIIAALRKRGTTLAAVSHEAGLSSSTLAWQKVGFDSELTGHYASGASAMMKIRRPILYAAS
ncbi:helix-turn-helix domain-containing protein [Xenorhabdus griffiniae]|uniref:Helix-turn-helix domain-containing protein n=1 Tax=Xenorhabdus griffiniae TaxID=351672 RepID=A0ABY9XG88_9GAMM|nr:helix-turn-helix domain-containing protein [Xenorhabdus griffiniae]WMV71949.1 helix-turn-helix domain-containing protein [Xenorhabdus griffiniae]WNH01626.1 helix-turn-helix domain-containing protein [Xenorhabdus griffiniae]